MEKRFVWLIAKTFLRNTLHSKAILGTLSIVFLLVIYAAFSGSKTFQAQNQSRSHYQAKARESWENNPDKHPHRMAHFGTFAFRIKHPLSIFDFGVESYTGNAVYLEAHKQNTINFSEASLSTGMLRFGEISMAMVLQIVLPLIIIFIGYNAVSAERENGTLKIILTQGGGLREVLLGKSLGLFIIAGLVICFALSLTLIALIISGTAFKAEIAARYLALTVAYVCFIYVVCVGTVAVSAINTSSKSALMALLGLWLLLSVILPRTTQAIGSYFFPAPSKIEFQTAIEEDVLQQGDSHNPDDPHYKHLRDSVLQAYQVDSVEKLPFNYSGFVMREGEKISANIYNRHLNRLLSIYESQNNVTKLSSLINPHAAIRSISMALCATDFESYKNFQNESESYRYQLAQKMNELQIELISNIRPGPNDRPHTISRDHWRDLPDFNPRFVTVGASLMTQITPIAGLTMWCVGIWLLISSISRKIKET